VRHDTGQESRSRKECEAWRGLGGKIERYDVKVADKRDGWDKPDK
jgi:hypothetical protein